MKNIREKVYRGVREAPQEFKRFFGGQYPAFVTSNRGEAPLDEVPIFMFHSLEKAVFVEQIEYLKRNGYRTLSLKEFMRFIRKEVSLKEPHVLLTFDDGDKSWHRVAYPVLKEHGYSAAGFIVPHYIRERPDPSEGKGWLSWPELEELEDSGVFDIQSHSYFHGRVFVEPELVGFFNPSMVRNGGEPDIPWIEREGIFTNKLEWGTPLFRSAPSLEGKRRFIDDGEIRDSLVQWVKSRGGEAFFLRNSWRRELRKKYDDLSVSKPREREYESKEMKIRRLRDDIVRSKITLEKRLNKKIEHLCYPWGAGCQLLVDMSREEGYVSNFWCSIKGRKSNRQGDSPYYLTRVKDDYIFRLPGVGRKSNWEIFRGKVIRRLKNRQIY